MPLAWYTVTGATQLFKLLPGVRVGVPGILAGTETIYLPKDLETTDFTRFQLYANFVKNLVLFKNPAIVTKINRWRELLQYTSNNILLPSLASICLGTYWPQSIPYYTWIAVFGSPSVRRIEIQPLVRRNLPTVSSETASALFNLLIDKCPKIESFSLFVDPKQPTSPLEAGISTDGTRHQSSSDTLFGAIKHIQSLSCTSSMAEHFQNTFSLLGRIPKLEALQIYASQQDGLYTISLTPLESGAFSRLRKLTLYDFGPHTTLSILNRLAPVTELTQVTLEISFNKDSKDGVSDLDGFYNTVLIPTIYAQIPHLTHLTIRPMLEDDFYVVVDNASLDILASLRLQSLTLVRTRTDVERIAGLFPHIQTLRWPDLSVTLDQLRQFTAYRQLERLSIKLDLTSSPSIEPLCNRAIPPAIPCVLESDYGNFDLLSEAETHNLLVRLVGIWSRPFTLQQATPPDYPHRDFAAQRRLEKLNKELEEVMRSAF
ncbi:unnamed protein product [Rhizoctonia solani]|uniref:Uncharacterized protein n=1 Tax=Rhizoctonia solani TaxID=456999 RepID=A0A8H3DC88_9AGAM|nr:unnamed protein product [Rhizoctonia solani]